MKLYTFDPAPNPRRLALFLRYKGIELDTRQVDLARGAQFNDDYRAINPEMTVPALVLDDGTVLTEVIGQCVYLEALYPEKPLLGSTPREKALVANWCHRVFAGLMQAIANVLRNRSKAFADRGLPGNLDLPQIPALVERGEAQIRHLLPQLDQHLSASTWVAGDNFSLADTDLVACVEFLSWIRHEIPADCGHLKDWYRRAQAELA